MNFVALRMLVGDRLKYLALIAGVSFAALLITQQASIFAGYTLRTGSWIRETTAGGADLWVMDPQVEFSEGPKALADTALQRVRGVSGVAWAVPLYKAWLECRLPDGSKKRVRLGDVDDAASILALDRAGGRPLRVGDRLDINDNEALVVGTYRAAKEFFWEPVV